MNRIKIIDLCSGAGGWACAARGFPVDIIMAVDLWDAACQTYTLNHPATNVVCGDLRDDLVRQQVLAMAEKVRRDGDSLVVVGGIPCEWLSVYRSLKNVTEAEKVAQRATLDSVLGLVRAIDPVHWCLEDVIQLIPELPPMTPYQVIDAAGYSCQRRKRVFVGDFPAPKQTELSIRQLRHAVRPGPYRIGKRAFGRTPQLARTFSRKTTLAAPLMRKSPTIVNVGSRRDAEMVIVDDSIAGGMRQMEWQEAAMIQGFPHDYVFYGSPTDVYLMIGRAIQIDLGREILRAICRVQLGEEVAA